MEYFRVPEDLQEPGRLRFVRQHGSLSRAGRSSTKWLDTWRGVGLLAVGLHRTGYDLDLRQYGDGHWCASLHVTGAAHSIVGGSTWEPTPWRAAAWEMLSGTRS